MSGTIGNARAGFDAAPAAKCPFALPSDGGLAWLAGRWCAEKGHALPAKLKVAGKRVVLTWADGRDTTLQWDSMRKRLAPAP